MKEDENMKPIKVVTIGGGSSYTPELIEGFIKRYDQLPVGELWLVDIEEGQEKLNIIVDLAKRMVKKAGIPMKIIGTLDRQKALIDADYVTTQLRVGQLAARAHDERIPLKYNTLGQETNGPGGLFKGLRTIPVILDICKDIEKLCPNAWLINFTNPAGMVTEAVLRYSNIKKVVGLCNGPLGMVKGFAKLLNAKEEDVYVQFQGLNHMVFATKIYHQGEDVTEKVVNLTLAEESTITLKNIDEIAWQKEFMERLGIIPLSYLRYYYQTDLMVQEQLKSLNAKGTRAEIVKRVEDELFAIYQDENLNIKPKQLEQRGGAYYSEAACKLICSIHNDTRDIQIVNTRNNGAIKDIDDDSVVEVNCVITKHGPLPITTGELPIAIKGLVQEIKSFERLSAEAAVTGDYKTALLAMTINPLVKSDADAKKMLDELLEAHADYLPLFNK